MIIASKVCNFRVSFEYLSRVYKSLCLSLFTVSGVSVYSNIVLSGPLSCSLINKQTMDKVWVELLLASVFLLFLSYGNLYQTVDNSEKRTQLACSPCEPGRRCWGVDIFWGQLRFRFGFCNNWSARPPLRCSHQPVHHLRITHFLVKLLLHCAARHSAHKSG